MSKTKTYSTIILVLGISSLSLNLLDSLGNSGLNRYIFPFRDGYPFLTAVLQLVTSLIFLIVPILCIVLAMLSFSRASYLKLGLIFIFIFNLLGDFFQMFTDLSNPLLVVSSSEYLNFWFKNIFIGLTSTNNGLVWGAWTLVSGLVTKLVLIIVFLFVINSTASKVGLNIASQKSVLPEKETTKGNLDLKDLEKLAELRDKAIITDEEFTSKKRQILDL